MALIESVFKRGAYDRTMSFQTIAEETRLPLDEGEHLVMKALRYVRIGACWFPTTGHRRSWHSDPLRLQIRIKHCPSGVASSPS